MSVVPTLVVLEVNGIGYEINISLNTFTSLEDKDEAKVYVYEIIREDSHQLFGFATVKEREVFKKLISVSGVGANTARLILSSLTPDDVVLAILGANSSAFKSVKGIGKKTSERIIVDLKDKVTDFEITESVTEFDKKDAGLHNRNKEDALSALVALGYNRREAEKVLRKVLTSHGDKDIAELVRESLKILTG